MKIYSIINTSKPKNEDSRFSIISEGANMQDMKVSKNIKKSVLSDLFSKYSSPAILYLKNKINVGIMITEMIIIDLKK